MTTTESHSVEQTIAFGRAFAERLGKGDCVALAGGLGAGKTVLTRGLAAGLGLADERLVSSPTFVLVQEYPGRVPVHHVDLYRMAEAAAELPGLAMEEMLLDGVVIVEWADRAEAILPRPHWRIDIEITGERSRRLHVRRVD